MKEEVIMDIEKCLEKCLECGEKLYPGITVEELYLTYMVEEKLMREGEKEQLVYEELKKRIPEWEKEFGSKPIKVTDILEKL